MRERVVEPGARDTSDVLLCDLRALNGKPIRLVRSPLLILLLLCYKPNMAKWFRRKKKGTAPDSESTGKVGQPKDPKAEPLQPAYIDDGGDAEKPPQPPATSSHRSSSATGVERSEAPRRSQPARSKFQMETQPESPSLPPAAAEQATGQPPQQKSARATKGVVVLAIGLPGSGKTTWFKRRGVTPLSSDMLRSILFDDITEQRYQSLVFSTLRSLLRARLIARMPWNYVDATNLSPRERKQWIHMARSLGYEVQAVFFDVPLEVCLERNRRRERTVNEEVMHRMAAKLRPPTFEEGFSKILVVRVKSGE